LPRDQCILATFIGALSVSALPFNIKPSLIATASAIAGSGNRAGTSPALSLGFPPLNQNPRAKATILPATAGEENALVEDDEDKGNRLELFLGASMPIIEYYNDNISSTADLNCGGDIQFISEAASAYGQRFGLTLEEEETLVKIFMAFLNVENK
jgi:hypothetical protein